MKIEYNDIDNVKKEAIVQFEEKEWNEYYKETLLKSSKEVQIPGFRKGKVPVNIVEKRLKDYINVLTGEKLVKKSFEEIKKEFGENFAGALNVEDFKIEEKKAKISFEVIPDFELKTYETIEIEEPEVDDPDFVIEEMIEKEREKNKYYITSESPAKRGDLVLADTLFYEKNTGKRIFSWLKNLKYKVGDEELFPQINEALEGTSPDEEVKVFIDYPEDYSSKELAGKSVGIKIKVKEIKTAKLPEINDEFAKMLGYKDLDEMKNKFKEKVNSYLEEEKKKKTENLLYNKLVEDHDFEIPQSLLFQELERVVREYNIKVTEENKDELLGIAKRRLILDIVLKRYAKLENVEVSDEEVKEEIRKYSKLYNISEEIFLKEATMSGRLENIRNAMLKEKVVKKLLEKVRYIQ